jgi:3-oxoacyl-[acyl-carrier protein] reductase
MKEKSQQIAEEKTRPVIIIGASGDIGAAIATAAYESGFRIILTYSKSTPINSSNSSGLPGVHWYHLDVTNPTEVKEFLEAVDRDYGPPFALIYSAGLLDDRPLVFTSDELWNKLLTVNLTGAFYCVRGVAQSMMAAESGRIIFIGSVSGRIGQPGQSAYSASKAGLEALCRVIAVELGRYNVTCNVVVPGAIESKMFRTVSDRTIQSVIKVTPLRRLGLTAEVAGIVNYLLSDDAGFMTGQTLVIDGGLTAT